MGVIPGMAPTGTMGDGESPNSSEEQRGVCVCVTQKEGVPGTERGSAPHPSAPPHPVLFNSLTPALLPRTPLWRTLGLKMGAWH